MIGRKRYPKGSEWRKWDLHTHTPLDHEWCNKPNLHSEESKRQFAKDYVEFAIRQNLSVIAITDHNFCGDFDELLIPYIEEEANSQDITILPGFEITTYDGSGIHLLVIFSENTDLATIKSYCDRCFSPETDLMGRGQVPASNLNLENINNLLIQSELDYIFIYAHADRNNGVLHSNTIQSQPRVNLWSNKCVKITQLSKSPSEFTGNFIGKVINGEDTNYLREDMVYITASDCRSIEEGNLAEGRNYLGQKFTWVKSDPTFEGLKQITHEPNRIRIQNENPRDEFKKPFFSSISISNNDNIFKDKLVKYSETNIKLNENLVGIIGGRGTGKSLLLDTIARTFGKIRNGGRESFINDKLDFSVTYTKGDDSRIVYNLGEENNLEYLHVHQSSVKEIVEAPSILHQEISKLLNLKELSDNKEEEEIEEINTALNKIKNWLTVRDENDNLIYSIEYNKDQKKRYEELISTITTSNNKQLIEEYGENNKVLDDSNKKLNKLLEIKEEITNFTEHINSKINISNETINNEHKITLIDFEKQLKQLDKLIIFGEEKLVKTKKLNDEIKQKFKDAGIEGDIATLLERVEDYYEKIKYYDEIISKITKEQKKIKELIEKRTELVKNMENKFDEEIKYINTKWENLKEGKEGWGQEQIQLLNQLLNEIEIYGGSYFDKEYFYNLVSPCLNKGKFRATNDITTKEKIKDLFNVNNVEDYFKLLKNEKIIKFDGKFINLEELLEQDIFIKDGEGELLEGIFKINQAQDKVVNILSKVKYKNKEPNELSVGQRGTLYICLSLATNSFSTPLIFDQPEDDLDNNFIMEELVPIIKTIKEYRQIIIVTHNANIVVNADAEQVIIANNENEEISYKSGSLEDIEIRGEVCKVLEGGERAFSQREKKYDLSY